MRIIYTVHAEEQLNERKIDKIWIEEAIKHPDLTARENCKNYVVKKLNSHMLKVVYIKEKYINVITCYFIK